MANIETISGHEDPEGESPWAMQLVLHIEKTEPTPTREDLCSAAASAVVRLLADRKAAENPFWESSIQRWMEGRIRKHARRARGTAWDRVQELEGITVQVNKAEVRAFLPTPVDLTPKDIARLQLSGTEPETFGTNTAEVLANGPVVVAITPSPTLTLGKAAAAAGHAAQIAWLEMDEQRKKVWASSGYQVTVEHPDITRWETLQPNAQVKVVDAGLTQVDPGTMTAIAYWK